MRIVSLELQHEDGRRVTVELPWAYDAIEVDAVSVGIALDYLGFDNPEPWTILSIDGVSSC